MKVRGIGEKRIIIKTNTKTDTLALVSLLFVLVARILPKLDFQSPLFCT